MLENGDEKEKRLYHLFGSLARVRILLFLLEQKGQKAYQRQIMHEIGLTLNPVQRELANLVDLGILKKEKTKSRAYYTIDQNSPLLDNLAGIIGKISQD
jgi:predicted transcriptional regulator